MKTVKFTFDTHFAGSDGSSPREASRPRKNYSSDEIDAVRAEAHREGEMNGVVRAQTALAGEAARIAQSLCQSIRAMDSEVENNRVEAAELAFSCANVLAGAALKCAPEAEIREAFAQALHRAMGEHRLTLRVPPRLVAVMEKSVREIAHAEGFEGRIFVVADGSLSGGDCRMEWKGGGIEHARAAIRNSLAELIERRFPAFNAADLTGECNGGE